MENPSWLASLLDEIHGMNVETFPPNHPIDEKDSVIGECEPFEKKVHSLERMYSKMRDEHKVEAKYHTAEEGCDVHSAKIEECHAKATLLKQILWLSIETRLDTWGADGKCYGVRAGWKIVSYKGDGMPPGLKGFIASMGGDE